MSGIWAVPRRWFDGFSPTIGRQLGVKGGDSFVILRRTGLGSLKVTQSLPLTEDGRVLAWQSLVIQNPDL